MIEVIACPECERKLRLPEQHLGRQAQCPGCMAIFLAVPFVEVCAPALEADPASITEAPASPSPSRARSRQPGRDERPRKRPRRQGGSLLLWLAMIVVGGLGVAGIFLLDRPEPTRSPRGTVDLPLPPLPRRDERRELCKLAFQDGPALAENDLVKELTPVLTELTAALRGREEERLFALVDLPRFLDEAAAQNPRFQWRRSDQAETVQGLRKGLGNSLTRQAQVGWESCEIRHVSTPFAEEVAVIARHRDSSGGVSRMRWWLKRQGKSWKIYDVEELSMGMRFSTLVAHLALDPVSIQRLATASAAVQQAIVALRNDQDQDLDLAEKKVAEALAIPLPNPFRSLCLLLSAQVQITRGQPREAAALLEQANKHNPDMICLLYWQGLAHNQQRLWDQARGYLEEHRAVLGEDADSCRELALAMQGLSRFAEAAKLARRALDLNSQDDEAFRVLLQSPLVGDRKDDLGQRFAKLPHAADLFDGFAQDRELAHDGVALEQLIQAMRKLAPGQPSLHYYVSVTAAWDRKADQAREAIRQALKAEPNAERRQEYLTGFLQAMAVAGKAHEAYAEAPQAREAFQILAAQLKTNYRMDDMAYLARLHARKHADDPRLLLYRGELATQAEQFEQADRAFEKAAKTLAEGELVPFQRSRVLARHRTGKTLAALAEIEPRADTFSQLAWLCLEDRNFEQLKALLDEQARHDPNDQQVPWFRLRMHARQKQAAEAVAIFRKILAGAENREASENLSELFLDEMAAAHLTSEGYLACEDRRRAFEYLADLLLEDGRLEDLQTLINDHRAREPLDILLHYYTGKFHLHRKEWDRAVSCLMEGWMRARPDQRERFRIAWVQAHYQAGRGRYAYRVATQRQETFEQLIRLMAYDRKWKDLEEMIRTHQAVVAATPETTFLEAQALIGLGKIDEGIGQFKKALEQERDPRQRQMWTMTFLVDMATAGKPLEAYRVCSDRLQAFEVLARRLLDEKKTALLGELLREQEGARERHPHFPLFQAEWHLLRGEADRALELFRQIPTATSGLMSWQVRRGLLRAGQKSGRVVELYREPGPARGEFVELAEVCQEAQDARQLEALLAVHRQAEPDDPSLPFWEAEVRWFRQDPAGTVQRLLDSRAEVFALTRYRHRCEDRLVRGLIRCKRGEEALQEAQAFARRPNLTSSLLLILAHAARGDVQQVLALTEKDSSRFLLLEQLYEDADLGPLLKSESFAKFRDRFPPPQPKEQK